MADERDQDTNVPVEFQDSTQQPGLPAEDQTPAADRDEQAPEHGDGVPGPRVADTDDNLLQLPDGASFGTGEQPSPAERERLLRHAGGVHQEMQGEGRAVDEAADGEGAPGGTRTRTPGGTGT